MKKNNFKKILVVFSLCVFLLSLFSVSSFALNISDVSTGYLYKFDGSVAHDSSVVSTNIDVAGYVVDKKTGDMIHFNELTYRTSDDSKYYFLYAVIDGGASKPVVTGLSTSARYVYIDYSKNTISKSEVESVFSQYWIYTVTPISPIKPMFDKASIALNGGVNGDGVAYEGLLGMVAKFGKFLVSTPLLLVLCIALPLVSFSVGLIIRIKNRA